MPAGIGFAALWRLVNETRSVAERAGFVAVSGSGAGLLAEQLTAGGDPGAVRVTADPAGSVLSIVLFDSPPRPEETDLMRRAARARIPLVVVRTAAFAGACPYVLPSHVVDASGDTIPLDRLVHVLASVLDEDAVGLAGQLPVLRQAIERRMIDRTALVSALIPLTPGGPQVQMPLLTLAQGRMLLRLGVAQGRALPHDPRQLATAVGPTLAGTFAAGFGLRALYRRLPVRGPLVASAVAYAGTRALGELQARSRQGGLSERST
jgi:uncharacterized protein (DUF697 family)